MNETIIKDLMCPGGKKGGRRDQMPAYRLAVTLPVPGKPLKCVYFHTPQELARSENKYGRHKNDTSIRAWPPSEREQTDQPLGCDLIIF